MVDLVNAINDGDNSDNDGNNDAEVIKSLKLLTEWSKQRRKSIILTEEDNNRVLGILDLSDMVARNKK